LESLLFLIHGFATALQPMNLLFALIGCLLGTLVGVLPGIGPSATVAILIPVTFVLDPTPAIIMLAGIYYGAQYGGTITAVLANLPGEGSSAITCLDGFQMAKNGQAGAALTIAAVGSFIGGSISTIALIVVALPLSKLALRFGPPEFFALLLTGLTMVSGLAGDSLVRALISATIGLLISLIGIDPVQGAPRFTFDNLNMLAGLNMVPVIMGLFGISEVLVNVALPAQARQLFRKVISLFPTREDVRRSIGAILRGSAIGLFLGIIPGIGAIIPTFISYIIEKKVSKTPEKFGTGMIEGVAGPETANNAYANAAMIPLFTLGIPTSPTLAVLMGALMMNGLLPGPLLFIEHSDFVWAVIASFFIGNVILIILNLPLIPMWVAVLKTPPSIFYTIIIGFSVVGAYVVDNNVFGVGVMLAFGVLGYIFKKLNIPLAPLCLTFILGPLLEKTLRQSLEMSGGDLSVFYTRPLTAALLVIVVIILIVSTVQTVSKVKGDTEL
jgi:putative tricarboxylic transport membrane protein